MWGINAKITDALTPSVVIQYCVSITEIIKQAIIGSGNTAECFLKLETKYSVVLSFTLWSLYP